MCQPKSFVANFGFALALVALLIARASAQDVPPEAPSDSDTGSTPVDDEVVVRGRRLSEIEFDLRRYVRDFLEQVEAPARAAGYARWYRTVCVGVYNLESDHAHYVVDRISALALDLGLEPGEPGCKPQVNIVFSTAARQLAANLVDSKPRLFRPVAGDAGMDLGLEALDEFVESERPVRWWHLSLPIAAHSGAAAIELPQSICFHPPPCPPWVPVAGPSRLHSGIRDDLVYVLIVVDATKLTGTTWQEIADYLAVVSLAQIDLSADPQEFDSILNLFSNPAAYSGLTDWDRNYLHALYAFDQERIHGLQTNEIVSRIAKRDVSDAE